MQRQQPVHIGGRVGKAELPVRGLGRLFAQQGHEIRMLERLQHHAQPVRPFRVARTRIVGQAIAYG